MFRLSMFLRNRSSMQNFARVFIIICLFLCLTLNYTFPFHRNYNHYMNSYPNTSQSYTCENEENPKRSVKHLFSKKSLNFGNNKKIKHSAQENKTINNLNNNVNNVDLRQYEQLVIMKKYPYLDIKELEMRYRPSGKHTRHSLTFDSSPNSDIAKVNEPSLSEQGEEMLIVEVSNRGLSGFAIPSAAKQAVETKYSVKGNAINPQSNNLRQASVAYENILNSLKEDVSQYLNLRRI